MTNMREVKIMKLFPRKAALLLTTTAAFIGLFWITAFTAEDVTQGGPSVALNIPAISAAPAGNSKTAATMDTTGIRFPDGTNS